MVDMRAIIEIPMQSRCKYEVDPSSGGLVLDRMLSMVCPANYGYIPNTLAKDGDALDVFVICSEKLQPLSSVEIELHAVVPMKDNGVLDEKIIATVKGDLVPETFVKTAIDHIRVFLTNYKKGTEVPSACYDKVVVGETIKKYLK